MQIGTVVADVNGIRFDPGVLKHITQTHTGPGRAANASGGPLIARGGRVEFTAAIPRAFQHHLQGVMFKLLLQLIQSQRHRLLAAFTSDLQRPLGRIKQLRGRGQAVVAHEEIFRRRDLVIQKVGRRFSHQRAIVEDAESVFTGDAQGLRALSQCGGDQTGGHFVSKNNLRSDCGGDGSQAEPAQKTAAIQRILLPFPGLPAGSGGVLDVKFMGAGLRLRTLGFRFLHRLINVPGIDFFAR